MSEDYNQSATHEAEPITKPKRSNGTAGKAKRDARPMPGINLRELYDERNWTALAGLGLMGLGVLWLIENVLGLDFNLWSIFLVGVGGWLAIDAWQKYESAGRIWAGNTRNRLFVGGAMVAVGLLSIFSINWWGLFLLGLGGWLGYDTYQRYEASGKVWTDHTRNRMAVAAVVGAIGLFGLLNLGSAWAIALIVIGGFMLYRHFNAH
jgi:hypothetical protein